MERKIAIKVINKALVENPQAVERFHREIRTAAQLDHPNIVRAFDAEQAGNLHMLVMEYVEGLSLAEMLERSGPLPVAHACHYVWQAALALQHAFEKGMVHRDLKPHNLMLLPAQSVVKVLDFGLARLASERQQGQGLTTENAVIGTPEYVAPEQASDARQADIRADIYSLGCTLYALLIGRPPFRERTAMLTVLAHREQEAVPLHAVRFDVPTALSAVVARMLAKDPARRYQTPGEVAGALAPFLKLSQNSATAGTVSPLQDGAAHAATLPEEKKTQPGPLPDRWRWRAAGLIVAAAVLGLGWVLAIIQFTSNKGVTTDSQRNDPKGKLEVIKAIKTCKRFFFPNAPYADLPPGPVTLDDFGRQNRLIMAWCDAKAPHYVAPLRRVWAVFLLDPEVANHLAEGKPLPAEGVLAIREADTVYNAIDGRLRAEETSKP
jgi:serine/threonine protein kinase